MRRLRVALLLALVLTPPATGVGSSDATEPVTALLFHESFAGPASLAERGWSVQLLEGGLPGFVRLEGAAATGTTSMPYPVGLDARLASPPLDLRGVPGMDAPPAEPPALPAQEAGIAWVDEDGARLDADPALGNATTWPPARNETQGRLDPARGPPLPEPSTPAASARVTSPDAGWLRLHVTHAWDLAPGDVAFAEVRVREPDGRWSPWEPLLPFLPPEEGVLVDGVLVGSGSALHNGDGGFVRSSEGVRESAYPLEPFAGRIAQVAFRLRSASPLAPESFGWRIEDVRVRALLAEPDLAVVGFEGVDAAAVVGLGVDLRPVALVRNWGPLPLNATLELHATDAAGRPLPGLPARVTTPALAPGELARVPYPVVLAEANATTLHLRAERVWGSPPDADATNDAAALALRFANVSRLELRVEHDGPVLAALGEPRRFAVEARNVGNVHAVGTLEIRATPLDLVTLTPVGEARVVASTPLDAGPPPARIARPLDDALPVTRADLTWTPDARGAYGVEATWSGGGTSPRIVLLVDASPPPALLERFAPTAEPRRPHDASSAALLEGWSFEAWRLENGSATRAPPAFPSPARALVGSLREPLDATASRAAARPRLDVTVPANASFGTPGLGNATVPLEVSHARLLYASGLEDPSDRVGALSLAALLNASVAVENVTVGHEGASFAIDGATVRRGDAEAGALYLVLSGNLRPGLHVTWSPLAWRRGNDSGELVAGGTLRPLGDGACCVLGPLHAEDILAKLPEAEAPWGRATTSRLLTDLLRAADATATGHTLALEHMGTLGNGTRAVVQLESGASVLWQAAFAEPAPQWEGVAIPLPRTLHDDAQVRLRITLEGAPEANASWRVDSLRLLERDARGSWRVVAADELEDDAAAARWDGDVNGPAGMAAPSADARGWRIAESAHAAPHRYGISGNALRWGEPDRASTAATEPLWSIARSPPIRLGDLPAPRLTLRTWHDFGPEENGTFAAGAALVALVRGPDGERRELLVPEGEAYRASIDAGRFDALARSLGILVPRGTSATALVGRSGVELGSDEAAAWIDLTADLSRLRLGADETLHLELHAVTTRPLRTRGWLIDDLTVGAPGPAHDLTIHSPGSGLVGTGTPAALTLRVEDRGAMPPASAWLHVAVHDATGRLVHAPNATLLAFRPGDRLALVAPAEPWIPAAEGTYRVTARLASTSPDERPDDDAVSWAVEVRDVRAARLAAPPEVEPATPAPDDVLVATVRVVNAGTVPVGPEAGLLVEVDVVSPAGDSLLARPAQLDVASSLGRPLLPGETATLRVPGLWRASQSGAFRVEARLAASPDVALAHAVSSTQVVVRERVLHATSEDFTASGSGWTNASRGAEPSLWSFVPSPNATGALDLRDAVDLTRAAQATLTLRHRGALELGFDGVRVEVQRDDGPWEPLSPVEPTPSRVLAPSAFSPNESVAVLGGRRDAGETRFDLAAAPSLRERLVLLDGTDGATEEWLGPAGPPNASALWAPRAPVPPAPRNAAEHEHVDALAFPLLVPAGTEGDLRIRFSEWRALGIPARGPGSRVEVRIEADGVRFVAEEDEANRYRAWTEREARFPGAASALAGRNARITFAHVQVSTPAGSGAFAPDALSPHGGWAIAGPRVLAPNATFDLVGPSRTSASSWRLLDGTTQASVPQGQGFRPLEPERVWADGVARATSSAFPEARLVVPLDLVAAVGNVTLTLNASYRLTQDEEGARSAFGVLASRDGGRSWTPLAPLHDAVPLATRDGAASASRHSPFGQDAEGDSAFGVGGAAVSGRATQRLHAFDLTAYRGEPLLLAIQASFATSPAAAEDHVTLHSARVEADVLRGGSVRMRLRGAADGDGAGDSFDLLGLKLDVVQHGPGTGVRLVGPDSGPLTEGFRTLVFEAFNRGSAPAPATTLRVTLRGPAGDHEVTRAVPPLAAGQRATIPVRGADLNWFLAADEPPTRIETTLDAGADDTFRADNALVAAVGGAQVRVRSEAVPTRLDVEPQVVQLANASRGSLTFRARVVNDGEDAASMGGATLRIYRGDVLVRSLTNARPATARLEPGSALDVTWSWRPSDATEPGAYRVVAEIATSSPRGASLRSAEAPLLVARSFTPDVARWDRFEEAPSGWACVGASPCAREEAGSLAVGLATGSLDAGRAVVRSPEFPAHAGQRAVLRMSVLHDLPAGEEVLVRVTPILADGTVGRDVEAARLRNASAGAVEGRFAPVEVLLAEATDARGFVVTLDAPRAAQGRDASLRVDDVSVSPLDVRVEPPPRAVLGDAVVKRLRFHVTNAGDLADEYRFRLADPEGRPAVLPTGWSARLLDAATGQRLDAGARLPVPANGTRAVDLEVAVPASAGGSPLRGAVQLGIAAESTLLPSLTRHVEARLQAQGEPRPDLVVVSISPGRVGEQAGRTRIVEVALANRGLAPAAATLLVRALPPADVLDTPEDLGRTTVALDAGGARVVSFPWTPRHAGNHTLVATWDPAGLVTEADRGNNEARSDAAVPPAPFPDLRVTLSLEGEDAALGAPLAYRVRVENHGGISARDVQLTLRAGVSSLLEDAPLRLGDVEPGASREANGSWTPRVPGDVRVVALAYARGGVPERVESLGDNAASLPLLVREVALRVEPRGEVAAPSGMLAAAFLLTNAGNAEERIRLLGEGSKGWSVATDVEGRRTAAVVLAPGASANVTLLALPPADARAGPTVLTLHARTDGDQAARAEEHVRVPRRGNVTVTVLPTPIDPDAPALEVSVQNDANAEARLAFEPLSFPSEWRLRGEAVQVPAGGVVRARLALDLGNDVEPRERPARVRWTTEDASGEAPALLRVAPAPRLDLSAEAEGAPRGVGHAVVRLRNEGNVPLDGVLRAGLDNGTALDLDGRPFLLAPGDAAVMEGRLALDDATSAQLRVWTEGSHRAEATTHVRLGTSELRLVERAPPTVGERAVLSLGVANAGARPASRVVVEVFVDGRAVASRTLGDLPPGGEADVDLALTLPGGPATVTAVAASPDAPDAALAWPLHGEAAALPAALEAAKREVPTLLSAPLLALALLALLRRRSP